jgi:hypothetical protein
MKYANYSDFNDVYKGKTIFIIGNGSDLLNLSKEFRDKLKNEVTIGTNASHLFLKNTSFHLSGHWIHLLFNKHYGNVRDCRVFQGPHKAEFKYKDNNVIDLEANNVRSSLQSFIKPVSNNSPLIGAEQIGLSATHIAWILGAKKIVYVGFDCKSLDHYYKAKPYINKVKQQYKSLKEKYSSDPFINSDLDDFWNINIDPGSIPGAWNPPKGTLFLNDYDSLLQSYSIIFNKLKSENIEVSTYNRNSILFEAGASLEEQP